MPTYMGLILKYNRLNIFYRLLLNTYLEQFTPDAFSFIIRFIIRFLRCLKLDWSYKTILKLNWRKTNIYE